MRIVSKKTLVTFYAIHQDAKVAIEEWYKKACDAEWDNFAQVKQTFNSADYVGSNRIVFNIRGNQYRLVTLILFRIKMVYIRFIGTHKEYDDIDDIKSI
ncbi:MAG: type II toxin-antitoxin system HigB family toxin [Bacteroidales bacterium]|nr:type II toxin-antitoxin system HigB family toxin [Bacteroidales bacterium]